MSDDGPKKAEFVDRAARLAALAEAEREVQHAVTAFEQAQADTVRAAERLQHWTGEWDHRLDRVREAYSYGDVDAKKITFRGQHFALDEASDLLKAFCAKVEERNAKIATLDGTYGALRAPGREAPLDLPFKDSGGSAAPTPQLPPGFTKWEGGECPVDDDTQVDVIWRSTDGEVEHEQYVSHRGYYAEGWRHSEGYDHIIAFKVIIPTSTDSPTASTGGGGAGNAYEAGRCRHDLGLPRPLPGHFSTPICQSEGERGWDDAARGVNEPNKPLSDAFSKAISTRDPDEFRDAMETMRVHVEAREHQTDEINGSAIQIIGIDYATDYLDEIVDGLTPCQAWELQGFVYHNESRGEVIDQLNRKLGGYSLSSMSDLAKAVERRMQVRFTGGPCVATASTEQVRNSGGTSGDDRDRVKQIQTSEQP